MSSVAEWLLTNAVVLMVLAPVIALITRLIQRPALACWMWTLLLLKLLCPPVVEIPIPVLSDRVTPTTSARFADQHPVTPQTSLPSNQSAPRSAFASTPGSGNLNAAPSSRPKTRRARLGSSKTLSGAICNRSP